MSNNEQNMSQEGMASGVGTSVPQGYAPQQQQHGQTPQPQQSYSAQQNRYHQHQYQQPPQHPHDRQHQQPPEHHENQNLRHGHCLSDAAAPALPPRLSGSTNRLMVQSTMDFPPPPRSPNKPPQLPPRPNYATHGPSKQTSVLHQQAGHPTTASHAQSLPQAWASNGQQWLPPPPPEPPLPSPSFQGGLYPPPPPGPPPQGQPISPIPTVPSMETPSQPGLSFPDSRAYPPPPYTAVPTISSAKKNAQHLCERTAVRDQPPPAPQAVSSSATSYDHMYGGTGLQQSKPTSESLPHLAPGINAPNANTTVANDECLPSMIERLNLRQIDVPVSPQTPIKYTSFTDERPSESSTLSLQPNADKLETHTPSPVAATSPTSLSYALPPRPGPYPTFMTNVLDGAPCTISSASDTPAKFAPATQPLARDGRLEECTEPVPHVPLLQEQCIPRMKSKTEHEDVFPAQPVSTAHQIPVQSPRMPSPDTHQQTATSPDPDSPYCGLSVGASFLPATHCIDTPVTFSTWWYSHGSAPDYPICSKCYMDKIYPTVFKDHFSHRYHTDGAERRCRFNVPRVIDQLLPDAVSRGTLDTLALFMSQRMQIADCRGVDGALGSEGIKWYAVKNNQIPGLLSCEACYHDVVCMSQFAFNFEQCPGQAKNDTWACDICVPFIRKEFELRTKNDDWPSFINEAKARIGMPACPKNTPIAFSIRKWFVPVKGQGPPDAVLCVACYCDYILKSGQEVLWEQETQKHATKTTNTCMTGMFHLRMALFAADEYNEWPLFWSVVNRIAYQERPCIGDGIVDGNWYTLPSQPEGYNVCGACHAGIVQSLHLEKFLVARTSNGPTPNVAHLCAFNVKSHRFVPYTRLMLQTWFTADCTAWDAYASRYAAVPTCPRNVEFRNRSWYGWPECVICADCYVDFVHGTALDTPERMTFHSPVILEAPHICEMYSSRMRQLYQQACRHSPPSTTQLFTQIEHRRLVYWQTIPQCRQLLMEEKLLANNISMARTSSVFYNAAGGLAAVGRNNYYTYGAAGVGYGYQNALQLTGAQYNAQANAMSAQLGGSKILIVGQLEQQWLAVE